MNFRASGTVCLAVNNKSQATVAIKKVIYDHIKYI